MKKVVIILFALFVTHSFAQNFSGKATYKTHRKVDLKINDGKGAPDDALQKQLAAQMKKMFQKTYTLNFTKTTSAYTQNKKLAAPQPQQGGMQIRFEGMGGGEDILYKNISAKRFVNKTEVMSKRFLIKDNLEEYGWELTSETKNIGNYTCYKATRKKEEKYTKFNFEDGKESEEEAIRIVETIAWYTPQIPVSNGPGKYWGLPGLILEIKEGKQTIVCTEVVLNPKDKIAIKEPRKGKVVTQKKYEAIMDKKSKEMHKRFNNGRKRKDGHSFSIQIGG